MCIWLGMLVAEGFTTTECSHVDEAPKSSKHRDKSKLTTAALAQLHGITLPREEELPASYTMRMWVTRRLASMQGRHRAAWQRIKGDPARLQTVRAATRQRVRKWRSKRKPVLCITTQPPHPQ